MIEYKVLTISEKNRSVTIAFNSEGGNNLKVLTYLKDFGLEYDVILNKHYMKRNKVENYLGIKFHISNEDEEKALVKLLQI